MLYCKTVIEETRQWFGLSLSKVTDFGYWHLDS